jgi:hypothetical protein
VISSSSRSTALLCVGLVALAASVSAKPSVEEVRPLVNRLASNDPGEREAASQALLAMGPDAIEPLLDIVAQGNLVDSVSIQQLLPRYGPGAMEAFHDAGNRDYAGGRPAVMWKAAAAAVARMGDAAEPVVMDWLTRENPYGSGFSFAVAVLAEWQRRDRRATPLLIPLLNSPQEKTREQATKLLADFPDPRAYDALLSALQRSEDPVVRGDAAMGLGRLHDKRASGALLATLSDPNPGIRYSAIAALGGIYDPRLRGALVRAARGRTGDSAERMVCDMATYVLTRSKDPIGERLGWRYKPISISPLDQDWIELVHSLECLVTAVVLVLLGIVGAWLAGRASAPHVVAGATFLLALACGLTWGRFVIHITGTTEDMLVFVVVPLALGLGYVLFRFLAKARFAQDRSFTATWACTAAGFYSGYLFGWLWLWGYLGF